MIRNGYSYVTLAKEINESHFGIKAIRKDPRTNDDRIGLISDYIYDNTPVIISVVFLDGDKKEGAHALLAIGIEVDSDENIAKYYVWIQVTHHQNIHHGIVLLTYPKKQKLIIHSTA